MLALTRRLVVSTVLALSLEEAKRHLRLDVADTSEDDYLTGLVHAVSQAFEAESNTALMATTYVTVFPGFGYQLEGLRTPTGEVTKVAYVPRDGGAAVELATTDYQLGEFRPDVLYVLLRPLPATQTGSVEGVRVYYTAGYPDATKVPELVKQWLKLVLAHWFESRQPVETVLRVAEIPLTAGYIMDLIREPVL